MADSAFAAPIADHAGAPGNEDWIYLYRVLQPERATLSLVRSGSSGREIGPMGMAIRPSGKVGDVCDAHWF